MAETIYPGTFRSGREDKTFAYTNNIYDEVQNKLQEDINKQNNKQFEDINNGLDEVEDKFQKVDDTLAKLEKADTDNKAELEGIIATNKTDADTKIKAETNRATTAETNLLNTINNIVDVSAQATTANLVTINPIIDTSATNVQQALEEVFTDLHRTYDTTVADLDIADLDGNVITRFSEGHIKTKNFDSKAIESLVAAGCSYAGIAQTAETFLKHNDLPIDKGCFFIATAAGTYNAWNKPDGLLITENEIPCIIKREANSSNWSVYPLLINYNQTVPQLQDTDDADLDISDEQGNIISHFAKGHIQTQEFNSKQAAIVKDTNRTDFVIGDDEGDIVATFAYGEIQTRNFDSTNTPKQKNNDDYPFAITDEEGNVIIGCVDGNIRTRAFDSATTPKQTDDNSNTELSIADEEGNVIVKFANGNIQVKQFNSSTLYENNVEDDTLIMSAISAKVITTELKETLAIINGAYVENNVLYI